ncbi:DNRLRE domain-containing protein [Frankia nepalensis]|uniref:DNRLRE domain-containing protein n=1 Tax=Frankia nepalensis TaxID=1836974 RepID=UPI0027DBD7D4|nr:DNRLRE domain-containing protein [Frankia nepalensis]
MALPLVPLLLVTGVALVVYERVTSPEMTPISEQNPFRDADVRVPESTGGSAEDRAHEVPTSATQGEARADPAKLRDQVPELAGTVPTTGVTPQELTVEPFEPQVASKADASAPREATFGESEPFVAKPADGTEMKPQAGRVEVPELQTESRQVFRNPDGTYTSETTMGSDRFQDARGDWVGIDTALVTGDKGRLRARSTEKPVDLATRADDPALARVDLGDGLSFAFGIAEASGAKAQIDGSKAVFAGVREDADVEVGPTADGLKEIVVLHSAKAPTTWVYPLTLTGLTAKIDGRQVVLTDKDGKQRAVIPPGSMMDSRPTTAAGFYASSDGVTYSLVTLSDGRQALRVDLDREWVTSKDRVFPILVDPSFSTLLTGADDTYVSSANPSTNYASALEIKSGVYGSDIVRGYLSFPGNGSLTNATVTNAHVKLFNWFSASGCSARPVSLRQVMIPWWGGNMTWPGATIGPEVAWKSFANDASVPACGGSWQFIGDYDQRLTNLVNSWTHNPTSNFGLAIVTSDTDVQWLKSFYSNNCWCNPATPASDYRPRMEIQWTPYGVQYGYPSGSPVWTVQPTTTSPGQIPVRLTNTGQATWPANGNYKLSYHIYDASNTTEIIHQGLQTNIPVTVTSGQTVDVTAAVDLTGLPAGSYHIRWDMEEVGVSWFSGQGVYQYVTPITLAAAVNQSPYIYNVSPLSGTAVPTAQPALTLSAFDPDNGPNPLQYQFQLCTGSDASSGSCWSSGWQSSNTWSPPVGALTWGQVYHWRGQVRDGAATSPWTAPLALQPLNYQEAPGWDSGENPYVPAVAEVHPLTQNYTTSATDAAHQGVGPVMNVVRTYNSSDSADGLFGLGWTTEFDTAAVPDAAGPGNVQVRYPDGRTSRFGRDADGSYQPSHGHYSFLQASAPRVASFTGANSTNSLGTTDTGESWQVLDGVWGVSGNTAYLQTAGGWFRSVAVVPAPSDGTIRFRAPVLQDRIGISFRVQDIDNMWLLYVNPSTNALVLAKRVGGWETTVLTAPNACCSTSDTYGVRLAGSQLSILRNNQVVATTSDSQFSSATRAGLYAQGTGAGRLDSLVITPDQHRDTFTNANSATDLGWSDDGEHWVDLAGTWGTSSNTAYLATAGGGNNLTTVGAAADGTITFTEPTAQAGVGVAFRVADAANYWRLVADPAAGSWVLIKRVAGTDSTVAVATGTCCTPADVLTIVTSGASIIVQRNGTQIISVKDPAVLYGSRAGPYADATGAGRIDNFTTTAATELTEKDGTSYTFRSDGRLVSSTDPAGNRVQLAYNANAQLTTATNATTGRALTFTWTGDGKHVATVSTPSVAAHSGPLTWSYTYSGGKLTEVVGPQSPDPTEYSYNGSGKLTEITLPEGNLAAKTGYNGDGTVAWREDGLGNRTTFEEIQTSPTVIVRTTSPNGDEEEWEYSAWGQLISKSSAAGERTFEYNDAGFLQQVVDENGNWTWYDTDDHGNVLGRWAPRDENWVTGETFEYFHGAPGDPRNDLVTVHRDGRSGSPTDDTYKTVYDYDALGHLASTTSPPTAGFPGGRVTSATYTAGTEAAVGGGTMPAGLLASYTDANGRTTTYEYSSAGDLRRDVDPVGLVHDYTYDELGRQLTSKETSDTYPAGLTTSYTYSKLSLVATVTEPGVTNPVTNVTHTRVTTNSYDANGNLTQTVVSDATGGDPSRTTTYGYDDNDRPVSTTGAVGTAVEVTSEVTYDDNGNVATATAPNGTEVEYTYTARNQVATTTLKDFVDDPVAGSSPRDVLLESRAYDPAGRLAEVTDALGRTTAHTYWLDDLLHRRTLLDYHDPDLATGQLSITPRDVVVEEHSYDAAGYETATATGGGSRLVTAGYDAAGYNSWVSVDPEVLNRWTAYEYDAAGNMLLDESGASGTGDTLRAEFTYDDASRMLSSTVLGDGADRFTSAVTRDQRGHVVSSVDARGYVANAPPDTDYVTDYVTDQAGRLTEALAPPVQVEENGAAPTTPRPSGEVGHNTFGELTHSRDARGQVTVTSYDTLGQVTQVAHPSYTAPGGSPVTPTEAWTYDDNGNVLTQTDARGEVTTAVYDRLDRLVAVTDPQVTGQPSAGVTRLIYDDAGNLTESVDQNGAWTLYAYDDRDQLWAESATERSPLGVFTTYYEHNDAGDVTRVLRPSNVGSGASADYAYNGAGDLVEVTDEAGKTTVLTYDHLGEVTSVTDPLGRETRYTYDRAGRLTTVAQYDASDTLLRTITAGYDPVGNPTSVIDPNGHTSTYTYDALNQPRTITVPVASGTSITTSAGYDAAGNRTRLTDGNGNATVFTYNSLGLAEKTIEPSTPAYPNLADRTWQVSYDAGGLATTLLEPGGVTRSSTYDELGRRTVETGSGGGAVGAARAVDYDLAGNLVEIDTPTGTQQFTYNDRNLVTTASGTGGSSNFVYDEDGRMVQRGDPGTWSNFSYDARGNLVAAGPAAAGGTRLYDYDDAGQLVEIDYDGGTGAIRTFDYDDLGRITADTLTGPGGTLRAQTYAYDDNDNLTSTTISPGGVAGAGTQTYAYDWADRLTSWTNQSSVTTTYGWDAAGNRTSVNATTSTFDARNRLTSDGTATYAYTARGTLSTRTAGATVTTTTFDAFNRLASHTAGPTTTSYTYDGLDRIARRNSTQNFVYSGLEKEPGIDGNSAYARDPAGQIIGTGSASGDWATLENLHGDIAAAFTIDGTALADSRSYDPFGVPIVAGDPNLRVGYQGSWTDPTTGLVNAQARWYDPATGTFLSRDTYPLPWTGTAADNRYNYAAANPLRYSDVTGNCPVCVAVVGAVAKGGKALYSGGKAAVQAAPKAVNTAKKAYNVGKKVVKEVAEEVVDRATDRDNGRDKSKDRDRDRDQDDESESPGKKESNDHSRRKESNSQSRAKSNRSSNSSGGGGGSRPAQQEYPRPEDVIHGPFYVNSNPLNGVGTEPDPGPRQEYSSPLEVNLGPTTDQTAGRQYQVQTCQDVTPGQCIGDYQPPPAGEQPAPASGESCAVPNSFDGDTEVLMADGTAKPIKDVDVGDRVLATDPETGRTEPHTVTDTIVGHGDKDLVDLTVATDAGPATIVATTGHPVWNETDDTWTDAGDLDPGDTLRQPDGTTTTVTAAVLYHRIQTVYNLTVDSLHTYYVLAGDTSVLVHNCGTQPSGGRDCACSNPTQGPGNAYSVAYETNLAPTSYPGVTRGEHFRESNQNLLNDMDADPNFDALMEGMIPGIRNAIQGTRGGALAESPSALGWTWHHHADVGRMQLVPMGQHSARGLFQAIFHPSRGGGFKIWG